MKLKATGTVILAVAIAAILFLAGVYFWGHFNQPPAEKKDLSVEKGGSVMPDTNWGAIAVPATVLWSTPGKLRDYDDLILRDNNDPAGWANGMDPAMRLWLVGKADTMALYGEPVFILERNGTWLKVAAIEQKTKLNEHGYPGWVPAAHIVSNSAYLDEIKGSNKVVVIKITAPLYLDEALTQAGGETPYQARLPLLREHSGSVEVRLPNGETGYLAGDDVKAEATLTFSRPGIVTEASQFLGLPYLWAGTAPYGFDCSGFTMRLYQSQGITIPRDADEQALTGTAVARQDLLPGDLLFYAAQGGVGQIHHVGMYIGDGLMIHSPNSTSTVRVEAMDNGSYGVEYWGARRYTQ
ncbi:MAG: C40 family peptidase [Desulfotomaculaceae bacterium]|nr:C40 family peptidase [Desulfotomaculaceae bacterium]